MKFVFDLETVPDLELIRRIMTDPPTGDAELLQRAGEEIGSPKSGFLPPMFHRVVCWVGLWIDNMGQPVNQSDWAGVDEDEGLRRLFNELLTYKDFDLIHHNGKGFDLPVLLYRSLRHGLQMPMRLGHHDIRYRFSQHNTDLTDEFSNYGASSYPKLKQLGALIGIPFKQTGDGDRVADLFSDGRHADILTYCHEDVMGTYLVWLHLQYTRGDLPSEQFNNLRSRALRKLKELQSGA